MKNRACNCRNAPATALLESSACSSQIASSLLAAATPLNAFVAQDAHTAQAEPSAGQKPCAAAPPEASPCQPRLSTNSSPRGCGPPYPITSRSRPRAHGQQLTEAALHLRVPLQSCTKALIKQKKAEAASEEGIFTATGLGQLGPAGPGQALHHVRPPGDFDGAFETRVGDPGSHREAAELLCHGRLGVGHMGWGPTVTCAGEKPLWVRIPFPIPQPQRASQEGSSGFPSEQRHRAGLHPWDHHGLRVVPSPSPAPKQRGGSWAGLAAPHSASYVPVLTLSCRCAQEPQQGQEQRGTAGSLPHGGSPAARGARVFPLPWFSRLHRSDSCAALPNTYWLPAAQKLKLGGDATAAKPVEQWKRVQNTQGAQPSHWDEGCSQGWRTAVTQGAQAKPPGPPAPHRGWGGNSALFFVPRLAVSPD